MVASKAITYTECKTFGHAWEQAPASLPSKVKRGFVLRCSRCWTVRHDHVVAGGVLDRRTYDYPEDYKMEGVKLTKDDLRKAMLSLARRALKAVS